MTNKEKHHIKKYNFNYIELKRKVLEKNKLDKITKSGDYFFYYLGDSIKEIEQSKNYVLSIASKFNLKVKGVTLSKTTKNVKIIELTFK